MRATGLQGDMSTEIIEILDDDSDIFGDRAPNITIRDAGGPRWVGPVAAVALVALIGYGVATSASKSAVPKVAPAPSTTSPPPTTVPAPTTIVPQQVVPYYAADLPREFSVDWADIHPADPGYYGNGSYMLWIKSGATAASGSWFSIESNSGGLQGSYILDAYRVASDQRSIAVSHTPTGQSIAQFFAADQSTVVTLTSFGLSDEDLVRLAASVNVGRDGVELTDPVLIADYRMLTEVRPFVAVQAYPAEEIFYSAVDDPAGGFSIIVSPRLPTDEGGGTFDRQNALRFLLDHPTTFEVDGHVAVAGSVIGQQDYAIATWIAKDHIVTLSASMPVQQLIAIARTVHRVSGDEWAGMQFQAASRRGSPVQNIEQTNPVPISIGTDANADVWTIRVSMATIGDQRQVIWEWDDNGFGTTVDGAADIRTVADNRRTYVLAELPRSIAPTAQLQITRAGLDPIVLTFADADLSLDRTFAAYAFSEPTQYTAQIIGEDGVVLATWPAA